MMISHKKDRGPCKLQELTRRNVRSGGRFESPTTTEVPPEHGTAPKYCSPGTELCVNTDN